MQTKTSTIETKETNINNSFKFRDFFQFCSKRDKFLLTVGTLSAISTGTLLPVGAVFLGDISQVFDPYSQVQDRKQILIDIVEKITVLACFIWLCGYAYFALWQIVAENISFDLRVRFIKAILKQEISYFEEVSVDQISSTLGEKFYVIQESIGQKFSTIIFAFFNILASIILAMIKGLDMALICFAIFPLAIALISIIGGSVKATANNSSEKANKLGSKIEESLSGIKIISSFAQEDREIEVFEKLSIDSRNSSIKSEYITAAFIGTLKFTIYVSYSFNFWMATIYLYHSKINPSTGKPYTSQDIVCILFVILNCTTVAFQIIPNFQAIIRANLIGKQIFSVINRQPKIADGTNTFTNMNLFDSIKFTNVTFKYPNAKQNIFERINFEIQAGKQTAIVGSSGSGKSTIIQLIERFYDPQDGSIKFGEIDIKDFFIDALRESIGYVQQEPVLILGSIRDNILLGNKDAGEDDIQKAIKMANASFIYDLEDQLDTYIGTSSLVNLSGGQKQRIAIARALIKNPKILILDEATSALDPKSEKDVQQALVNIQNSENSLTTIVIAHRLQTIQSAQHLIYFKEDRTIEIAQKGSAEFDQIFSEMSKNDDFEKNKKSKDDTITNSQIQSIDQEAEMTDKVGKYEIPMINTSRDLENQYDTNSPKQILSSSQVSSDKEITQQKQNSSVISRINNYYGPKFLVFLAMLASLLNSFTFPLKGMIYMKNLFVLSRYKDTTFIDERNVWCSIYLALALYSGLFDFLARSLHKHLSENLSCAIRNKLYSTMIKKNVSWFDRKDRAPGILINIFSEDITAIKGLTGEAFSNILEAIMTIIVGGFIALNFHWKMAVISLATSPFVMFAGFALQLVIWNRTKSTSQQSGKNKEALDPYDKANALVSEILMNYKTVISFGPKNVDYLVQKYANLLEEPKKLSHQSAHLSGFMYGYYQGIRFLFLAFNFYISTIFIFDDNDDPEKTFIAIYTVMMAAFAAGGALSLVPSFTRSKNSANKIFGIIEDESTEQFTKREDKIALQSEIKKGTIEFINVEFKYPSREQQVLRNLSFKIQAGTKVAIVGHSGSGKSTIGSLILRMYDKSIGQILIDDSQLEDYDIKSLRRQIGYVMQEPKLFNISIKENIIYGNRTASNKQIKEAAQLANCLHFIEQGLNQAQENESLDLLITVKINKNEQKILELKEQVVHLSEDGTISSDQLRLIEEIFENSDDNMIIKIDSNFTRFIQVVQVLSAAGLNSWVEVVQGLQILLEIDAFHNEVTNDSPIILEGNCNAFSDKSNSSQQRRSSEIPSDLKTVLDLFLKNNSIEYPQLQEQLKLNQERAQILKQGKIGSLNGKIEKDNSPLAKTQQNIQNDQEDQQLHEGFNRLCGLQGSMLSGGQKQRIAIARALIKDPKILILDEATSALDEQSQKEVQLALDKAMEGRTSIIIAHRLSTIQNCEWILVMHQGQIIEQGTFQNLSENNQSYFYKLKTGMEM
ncbi:abc transporter [Stylonychia lemnae]|uniref:Abc transporter n=1 Tax=Stylonychia lemnae TaxID=5949 RepID=A0A078ATV9_STYLE|nr:abc transporter [Stylonychia lemnae]|eukprot:CDW84672.1 abc transporter [Stylonychia lemnae]